MDLNRYIGSRRGRAGRLSARLGELADFRAGTGCHSVRADKSLEPMRVRCRECFSLLAEDQKWTNCRIKSGIVGLGVWTG